MTQLITQGRITNPLAPNLSPITSSAGVGQFQSIISTVISLFFIIGILLFFAYFLIGAIKWITSGGDKQAVEGARGTIAHAIIGLVILFTLFAAVKIIEAVFGVCILSFSLPLLDSAGSGCTPSSKGTLPPDPYPGGGFTPPQF